MAVWINPIRFLTNPADPMWYKVLLTALVCLLLGELLIILWASWAILTFE